MTEISSMVFSNSYLQSLLIGDRLKCSAIVKEYLNQNDSITDLYENVLKVALYEVGRLWETNKIAVATEHLATAITEGILNQLFEKLISSKRMNKKVVLACVENEQHQVGIKMVADTFEMNGWESYFLGAGIPLSELIRYIREVEPDLVAISLSIYFNFANLVVMIEKLRQEFADMPILVGGQAFKRFAVEVNSKFQNVNYFSDLYLLGKYIEFLNSNIKM